MSRCRLHRHLFWGLGFVLLMSTCVSAQSPFTELTDVPLMDGMKELPDDWMQFDVPAGHILQTRTQIKRYSKDQVRRFYQTTLPAVGWIYDEKDDVFARESDVLTIGFEQKGDLLFVLFEIKTK